MADEDPHNPLYCSVETEQETMDNLIKALQESEEARRNLERAHAIEKTKRENAEKERDDARRALGVEVERRMTIEDALVVMTERYVLYKSQPMMSCACQHRLLCSIRQVR